MYKVESFYQFWHQTLNVEKQLLQWLENAEKQGYSVGTVFNQVIIIIHNVLVTAAYHLANSEEILNPL